MSQYNRTYLLRLFPVASCALHSKRIGRTHFYSLRSVRALNCPRKQLSTTVYCDLWYLKRCDAFQISLKSVLACTDISQVVSFLWHHVICCETGRLWFMMIESWWSFPILLSMCLLLYDCRNSKTQGSIWWQSIKISAKPPASGTAIQLFQAQQSVASYVNYIDVPCSQTLVTWLI